MSSPRSNIPMFRRLIRRLLFANRGRLFVILLALSAGAAVSAALLNLQTDAKHRLTTEFRSFGANILVLPKSPNAVSDSTMTAPPAAQLAPSPDPSITIHSASLLYAIANANPVSSSASLPVVVVGYSGVMPGSAPLDSLNREQLQGSPTNTQSVPCIAGQQAAAKMNVKSGDKISLRNSDRHLDCVLTDILKTGDVQDGQLFLALLDVQQLANTAGKISAIQINASGNAAQIEQYGAQLRQKLPDAEIRPLRQFSEAQARIYSRISGLLTAATILILSLTVLCVMAAMTNIAAERKQDVGMMKAIGGSASGILNLFLTEAALLGLAGGLIGAAAGIALSMVLGKAVFGIAAAPRLIVYPISVALTVIVAILGAYPLRRLANVRPAKIFRGDA
ncbi:MAG TPA: ABC transporter permease [Candidatus Acidoferrum sp.]|nr:ABC transporter permease [Candidatus Acidoferrum sp.]